MYVETFLIAFPHISQLFKVASQNEFDSIWHDDEQPSPEAKFPSSHPSIEDTIEFPHTAHEFAPTPIQYEFSSI